MSGLPFRGSRRNSDASIWILAICLAVVVILRVTADTAPQESVHGQVSAVIGSRRG